MSRLKTFRETTSDGVPNRSSRNLVQNNAENEQQDLYIVKGLDDLDHESDTFFASKLEVVKIDNLEAVELVLRSPGLSPSRPFRHIIEASVYAPTISLGRNFQHT